MRSNKEIPRFLTLPPAFSMLATRNGSAVFSSSAAGAWPGFTAGSGINLLPPDSGLDVGADAVSGAATPAGASALPSFVAESGAPALGLVETASGRSLRVTTPARTAPDDEAVTILRTGGAFSTMTGSEACAGLAGCADAVFRYRGVGYGGPGTHS